MSDERKAWISIVFALDSSKIYMLNFQVNEKWDVENNEMPLAIAIIQRYLE